MQAVTSDFPQHLIPLMPPLTEWVELKTEALSLVDSEITTGCSPFTGFADQDFCL